MSVANRISLMSILLIIASLGAGCSRSDAREIDFVDRFMAALQAQDVEKIISLYSDDFSYINVAIMDFGAISLKDYQRVLRRGYAQGDGIFIPDKAYRSQDGKSAALSGTLIAEDMFGRIVNVPMVMIIEIRDGKIFHQTDYFDGRRFIK